VGRGKNRAVTLVEAMVSLFVMSLVMLGLLGNFVHSRRITENSVLHAASTSLIYGVIEQIKQLDYVSLLPNYESDPSDPDNLTPPYIRVRISQEKIVWLRVVHTTPTDEDATTIAIPAPKGPLTTPSSTATAASVGAIDNFIGSIPLSTITGSTSQEINLNIWVWIDEISNKGVWAAESPAPSPDTSDVKKITVVYTYSFLDGNTTRTIRDREVIIRSRFDQ
jgi:hypothetical protein